MSNQFAGLSTLRAAERRAQPVSESSKAMAAYLSKYTEGKRERERDSNEGAGDGSGDGGDNAFDLSTALTLFPLHPQPLLPTQAKTPTAADRT